MGDLTRPGVRLEARRRAKEEIECLSDQINLLKINEINIKRGVVKEKGKRLKAKGQRDGLRPIEARGWRQKS